MKILDLRPWYERCLTGFWRRQKPRPTPGLWDRLGGGLTAWRVAHRSPAPDRPFVVSVGNLSLGGSGKTPVVEQLAADLAGRGTVTGVLTRGYRSSRDRPGLVLEASAEFGDEARLLACRLTAVKVPVVQAADRVAGLALLMEHEPGLECVILEDGFQTRGLGRHLDVLILEAWSRDEAGALVPLGGPLLPRGPWREPVSAATRADVWLVESEGPVPATGQDGTPVASFFRRDRLVDPQGNPVPDAGTGDWAALTGIAHPEGFESSAETLMNGPASLVIRCRDHEPYGQKILDGMSDVLAGEGIGTLVTTAKDWVKLAGRMQGELRVLLVVQDVVWKHDKALPDLVRERMRGHADGAEV